VLMVAAQVLGHDVTIAFAGAAGNFELNVMMPVIAWDLLQSIETLGRAAGLLADRCVAGLEADRGRLSELVERSLAMVTALVPRLGYDRAAELAREALASGRSLRDVCLERGVLPAEELARLLDPAAQTDGGLVGGRGGRS